MPGTWPRVRAVAVIFALLGPALSGCSILNPAPSAGDTATARASQPCLLMSQPELTDLVEAKLAPGAVASSRQEADGHPGRVCSYHLDGGTAGSARGALDGGVEVHTYTDDTRRSLAYYRSLASDFVPVTGLGQQAWWSDGQQRLLVLTAGVLMIVDLQLPGGYQDAARPFALAAGQLLVGRL